MKIGVYKILNKNNGKAYIGSTSDSFRKRWNLHRHHLRNNIHKNTHLQNSWNKHGEDSFDFLIVEECGSKDEVLIREQYYIDLENFENIYNINPYASGGLQFSKDIIDKRSETNRINSKKRVEMYNMWKNGDLKDSEISDKNLKIFKGWIKEPWNKGIKYTNTDHLKVPKKKKGNRDKFMKTMEDKMPMISIYSSNNTHLIDFKNARAIEEYSESDICDLPIISKSKSKKLAIYHINKSCKTGKPYKGLYFKYKS